MLAKEVNTLSKIIHKAFPHTTSALIVFVDDDYTRLDFYHLGRRGRIFEVPFGTEHLLRKISEQFNISPSLASSHLALLKTDSLDFKTTRIIEDILESGQREFVDLWNRGENFKIDSPFSVFVHVNSPFEEFFKSIIERITSHNKISILDPKNELTHRLNTEYSQIL